jgi:GGDEF domain-containing protein
VYNEEAFRYFLEIERKRSELSNRPLVLLLLDLKKLSPHGGDLDTSTVQKVFSALSVCVRETDFVGWYRAHSVAGAVLTQHSDTVGADLQEVVSRRIARALSERLPSELADQVRVRVYQLPSVVQSAI